MALDIVTSRLTASFRLFVRVEPLATVSDLFQSGFSSLVHWSVRTDPVSVVFGTAYLESALTYLEFVQSVLFLFDCTPAQS